MVANTLRGRVGRYCRVERQHATTRKPRPSPTMATRPKLQQQTHNCHGPMPNDAPTTRLYRTNRPYSPTRPPPPRPPPPNHHIALQHGRATTQINNCCAAEVFGDRTSNARADNTHTTKRNTQHLTCCSDAAKLSTRRSTARMSSTSTTHHSYNQ